MKCLRAGRCGHRPLRKHNKKFGKRAVGDVGPYGGYKRCGESGIPQSRLCRASPL